MLEGFEILDHIENNANENPYGGQLPKGEIRFNSTYWQDHLIPVDREYKEPEKPVEFGDEDFYLF